ncbi:MAG: hypothetical protein HOP10_16500 [Chitinophagaceae bacterium]|nr:hypothetical protein [Chitinophagaceae bacterium]
MKGSNKFLTIAVILLLLINVAMLVFMLKGKRQGDKKAGGKDPFGMMVKELGMTEQQQTQFKQMKEEHFNAIRPVLDSIRGLKKSMFNLVKEESVNDSLVSRYSGLIAEQQEVVNKTTIAHFRKVRTLFTGDQQTKFDDFIQKMIQRRRGPGGKPDSSGGKMD